MSTTMQTLFDEHAGLALSKQRDLASRIQDLSWGFDMDAGTMTFTKRGFLTIGRKSLSSACQILGSESEQTSTWLWAWANHQSGIPPKLLRASESLRALGERFRIPELVTPEIPLGQWDGHRIAMLAAGSRDCAGYYRGPYPGGAIFVLLTDPALATPVDQPLLRFVTQLPELVAQFAVHDHRLAAQGLALGLGLRLDEQDTHLSVSDGRSSATVELDTNRRVSNIRFTISGAPA
jgi:hypothetical protein